MWFDAFDCASFVLRAFQELANLGTKFNESVHLNYTRIHLYSDEPQYLGDMSLVKSNNTLAAEVIDFYRKFQSHQNFTELLKHMIEAYEEVFEDKKFYFFFNYEYWFLPMKPPYIKLTYLEVPLPKANPKLVYKQHGQPWNAQLLVTIKILKIRTPEKLAVITLKFEQGAFTIE